MEDLGEIDCSVLKRLLKDDSAKCLLLDCRSFLAFSAGHIRGAVNARCNTIVRRRAKGSALSLDQILAGDEEVRGRLRSGMFSAAVLYDERTPDSEAVKEDSTLAVALNALCRDASGTNTYLLKGTHARQPSTSRTPALNTAAAKNIPIIPFYSTFLLKYPFRLLLVKSILIFQ